MYDTIIFTFSLLIFSLEFIVTSISRLPIIKDNFLTFISFFVSSIMFSDANLFSSIRLKKLELFSSFKSL